MASNKPDEAVEITPVVSTGSLDDNYELYKSMRGVEVDPLEAKKVIRKVDTRILSLLMVTYFLQYLDKNSINLASVYGLKKDTHLGGQDYSWLGMSKIPSQKTALLTSDHSYNVLSRIPRFPIPIRIPPPTSSNRPSPLDHSDLLGLCSPQQPCLHLIRWNGNKSVHLGSIGKCYQPRIRSPDVHVVHNWRPTSTT